MKKIHFIIQAKGGAGKSMLTYLFALKNEDNPNALFIDLDSSTKTSVQQLNFLSGRTPARLAALDLLDERKKIVRDKLLETIERTVAMEYTDFYFDFGAPESEQLPSLLNMDFNAKNLKEFEEYLGVKFIFNIVIAGGTAYQSSTDYLLKIVSALETKFDIILYANQFTFYNFSNLLDEIKKYGADKKNKITDVKIFGDFDTSSETGKGIVNNIEKGRGYDGLSFPQKLKLKNEFEKI